MDNLDIDGEIIPALGKLLAHLLAFHKRKWNAESRRLDGCRTIGYSQILTLREIMHKIQVKSGLEQIPKVSDRVSLIGGSGMGGCVLIPSKPETCLLNDAQNDFNFYGPT